MSRTREKVLLLRRIGLPVAEIAKAMGTSSSSVYYHLRKEKRKNDAAAEIKFLAEAIKILEARVS